MVVVGVVIFSSGVFVSIEFQDFGDDVLREEKLGSIVVNDGAVDSVFTSTNVNVNSTTSVSSWEDSVESCLAVFVSHLPASEEILVSSTNRGDPRIKTSSVGEPSVKTNTREGLVVSDDSEDVFNGKTVLERGNVGFLVSVSFVSDDFVRTFGKLGC